MTRDELLKEYEQGRRDFRGVVLRGVDLRGADLSGVDLSGASLGWADLRGASLGWADLRGASLRKADLGGASLSGADLRKADLGGADLGGASLSGADLSGADLGWADLRGASLGWADLRGAANADTAWVLSLPTTAWSVAVSATRMKIGCQEHAHAEWARFSEAEIGAMHPNAVAFWAAWRGPLLALCAVAAEWLVNAQGADTNY